jgi:phosphate uptake regulator
MLKELLKLLKKGSLLDQSFDQALGMLDTNAEMLKNAVDYLHGRNEIDVKTIYEKDKLINLLEQKIRRNIYNHLLVTGNQDLYMSLVITHLIIDLERVGDYTKNVVELRLLRDDGLNFHEFADELDKIEKQLFGLLDDIKISLKNQDEKKALEIQKKYYETVQLCDKRDEEFLKKEFDYSSKDIASLVLYYRYLKRIFSHLINVASAIANPYDRIGFHPQDII